MFSAGWGFFLTPDANSLGDWKGPIALDNGAWSAYQKGEPWSPDRFIPLVERYGEASDFVVSPDIVAGGLPSLKRSLDWLPRLLSKCPRVLIPVQDGMSPKDVEDYLSDRVGVFVGGSTDWKLGAMRSFCEAATRRGAWSHVGRVNSVRRINLCLSSCATSFDGTSVSRYVKTLPSLDAARRQSTLFDRFDNV